MTFLSQIFNAIAAVFGFASKRSDLNNTDDMKKRDGAQKEIDQNEDDIKDIRNGDIDNIRSKLS